MAQVPNDPQPLRIGLGKNQPVPLVAVDGAIAAMQADGSLNQLMEEWSLP